MQSTKRRRVAGPATSGDSMEVDGEDDPSYKTDSQKRKRPGGGKKKTAFFCQ